MDRDHFYITLFSNASQHIHPDNKIAAFTIQLAQPIRLDPSEIWEVGLFELSFSARQLRADNTAALVYCDLIAPQLIGTRSDSWEHLTSSGQRIRVASINSRTFITYPWKENVSRHTYRNTKSVG